MSMLPILLMLQGNDSALFWFEFVFGIILAIAIRHVCTIIDVGSLRVFM